MKIQIKCDTTKVAGIMRALDEGFRDFRPLLKEIGAIQLKSADESFKTMGNNLGKPWAHLKTDTIKQKMRMGNNVGILQRTGKMRRSFAITKLTNNELNIENPVLYFRFHQLGTRKMPQRQMMGHSRELKQRHKIAFVDYTLKLIRA